MAAAVAAAAEARAVTILPALTGASEEGTTGGNGGSSPYGGGGTQSRGRLVRRFACRSRLITYRRCRWKSLTTGVEEPEVKAGRMAVEMVLTGNGDYDPYGGGGGGGGAGYYGGGGGLLASAYRRRRRRGRVFLHDGYGHEHLFRERAASPGTRPMPTTPPPPVRELQEVLLGVWGNTGYAGRVVISYVPTVTLADHAAGQESNKFAGVTWVRAGELFAFKLTNNTGSQVTVTQVQFQLSSVTGIAQGDVGNFLIYQDDNNDGAIGAGETTTVGGTGAVNAGMTTITFSTSFTVAASTTVNYILKGNAANLASDDTMTIALGKTNITLSSGSVGGSTTSVTQAANPTKVTYSSATTGTSVGGPHRRDQHHRQGLGRWRRGRRRGRLRLLLLPVGMAQGAGFAKATITVTAGETLTVRVGGGAYGGGNCDWGSTSAAVAAVAAIPGCCAAPRN